VKIPNIASLLNSNQKGASLIELIAALGVSAIVLLGAASALILTQNNNLSLSDKIQAEEEVNRAAFPLRHFISMALNIVEINQPVNGKPFDGNIGMIARYDLLNWTNSTGPGAIDVVSFFIRENFLSTSTLPASIYDRFPITTIFFQRPTVNKFGVLYINTSKNVPSIAPTDSDFKVSHIVNFEITEVYSQIYNRVSSGIDTYSIDNDLVGKKMVTGVSIKIVTRNYFNGSGQGLSLAWCPQDFMPGGKTPNAACKINLPYKDTEKNFTFTLRNNVTGRSLTQRGKAGNTTGAPNGLMAPIFRRPLEATYFLSPALPIGAITR
jgi:hypothetical protein